MKLSNQDKAAVFDLLLKNNIVTFEVIFKTCEEDKSEAIMKAYAKLILLKLNK